MWKEHENTQLKIMWHRQLTLEQIGQHFQKSGSSCHQQAQKLGLGPKPKKAKCKFGHPKTTNKNCQTCRIKWNRDYRDRIKEKSLKTLLETLDA